MCVSLEFVLSRRNEKAVRDFSEVFCFFIFFIFYDDEDYDTDFMTVEGDA